MWVSTCGALLTPPACYIFVHACDRQHRSASVSARAPYQLDESEGSRIFGSIFAALLAPALPAWVKLADVGIIAVDATGWHIALVCFFSTRRAQQVYRRIKRWMDRGAGAAFAFLRLRLMIPSN